MAFIKFTGNTPFVPCPKSEPKVKDKAKPIKKLSVKREKQNKEYLILRKVYLEKFPKCEIQLPCCTFKAVEIHHENGRIGSLLTDVSNFLSTCRACHNFIHTK